MELQNLVCALSWNWLREESFLNTSPNPEDSYLKRLDSILLNYWTPFFTWRIKVCAIEIWNWKTFSLMKALIWKWLILDLLHCWQEASWHHIWVPQVDFYQYICRLHGSRNCWKEGIWWYTCWRVLSWCNPFYYACWISSIFSSRW